MKECLWLVGIFDAVRIIIVVICTAAASTGEGYIICTFNKNDHRAFLLSSDLTIRPFIDSRLIEKNLRIVSFEVTFSGDPPVLGTVPGCIIEQKIIPHALIVDLKEFDHIVVVLTLA